MATTVSRMEGDYHFPGAVSFQNVTLPNNAVGDAQIPANAKIDASKLRRRLSRVYSQGNVAAVTETKALHVGYGATGLLLGVRAGDIARATGAATVTFMVRKNGVNALTGVITLNNANPAGATYGAVAGVVDGAVAPYVAGDVFDVVITAAAGGGVLPTGVWVELVLDEDPS